MSDHPFTVRTASQAHGAQPQANPAHFGKVVQRMPVYDMKAARTPGGISRLLGFDVVFEFAGERYQTRVPRNPGNRIAVDVVALAAGAVADFA